MPEIHPTAIIAPGARLADSVSVGPFCIVGGAAVLGEGVRLMSHVVIEGLTTIGQGTVIHTGAVIGGAPQSLGDKGEDTAVAIGAGCILREHVTVNRGTIRDRAITTIGDRCFIMTGAHIGHDCSVGNDVVMANNALLAGHVQIADFAWVGGGSAIHQFARVGRYAFVGGAAALEGDLIPYGSAIGNRASLEGLNLVGLKRRGVARDRIHRLRNGFEALFFGEGDFAERLGHVAATFHDSPEVEEIVTFIRNRGKRPLCLPGQ